MLPITGEGDRSRHDKALWENGGHLNGLKVTILGEDELDNVKRECRYYVESLEIVSVWLYTAVVKRRRPCYLGACGCPLIGEQVEG